MSKVEEPLPEALDLSAIQNADASTLPNPKNIDIGFFSHRNRKSTQLVGNKSEDNFIKARNEWMDFDFTEIIYVTYIEVFASGYENYHELELSFREIGSKEDIIEKARFADGSFKFSVKRFIGGFGLKPNERWFKDSKINIIEVKGIEQKYFSEVISIIDDINGEKEKIEAKLNVHLTNAKNSEIKFNDLQIKIEELNSSINDK